MYGYIYITTNTISGTKYIGQKKGQFNSKYLGSGVALHDAIKKYGKDKFVVELLSWASSRKELNLMEADTIRKYDAVKSDKFYNLAVGGDAWGCPHTEETRKKISKATTGRKAHNKGKPNLAAKKRMLENNPMHMPGVAKAVARKRAANGWEPSNKITKTFTHRCEECGREEEQIAYKKSMEKRFCGKSCAASYSNKRRKTYRKKD